MPQFSVIIPAFNRGHVLPRAIDSVRGQSFDDCEIIVIDDGSDDCTKDVTERYREEIRIIEHDTNKGQNVARNTGLKAANGKYISYLDSDDELLPSHLEKVNNQFSKLPDSYGAIVTATKDIDDNETTIKRVYDGKITLDDLATDLYRFIAGFTTLTIRSDILQKIGYHDERITIQSDLDFYLQILEAYDMYGLNEVLCTRYKQPDSVSRDANKLREGDGILVEKHGDKLTPFNRSKLRYHRAIAFAELGEMRNATKWFGMCVLDYPYRKKYLYHFLLALFGERVFKRHSLYGRSFTTE